MGLEGLEGATDWACGPRSTVNRVPGYGGRGLSLCPSSGSTVGCAVALANPSTEKPNVKRGLIGWCRIGYDIDCHWQAACDENMW